ncbi:hypothetical protein FHT71_002863 [Rhizobium sp. BK060]|nr:hypothetical protein [Rhizobium sp. BK060]
MTASMHCSRQSRILRGRRCTAACCATTSAACRISTATGRKKKFNDIAEVRTEQDKLHLFVAINPVGCRAAL